MEIVSFSSNLYSHPEKLLESHLINVAEIAYKNAQDSPIEILFDIKKNKIAEIVKLCGLCHDLGKSTEYFQKYLFANEEEKGKLKVLKETHHSLLSSVTTLFLALKRFENDDELDNQHKLLLPFLAFISVKRHHGDLEDVLLESILDEEDEEILHKQVNSIDSKKFSNLMSILKEIGLNFNLNKESLHECIPCCKEYFRNIRRKLRKFENIEAYILSNLIFSFLIDADKSDVGVKNLFERRKIELSYTIVDNYKSTKSNQETYINKLRDEAYREVINNDIDLNQKIYSINLPTGLGKTFASFAFALKLREKIRNEKGYTPRIIYSLPFLSIIDQNAQEIENILTNSGNSVETDILLKHHHLSDIYYKTKDNEFEPEEAKLLIEGWNSEIIVTTFVQLFHTLISNRNKPLLKFHRLIGSIIVLDEVQSIPFKYWLLLRELIKSLVERIDLHMIFVTATQPLIIPKEIIFPLADAEKYFNQMDRVILKVQTGTKMSLTEFIDTINLKNDKSYLFVLNTITSAKDFFELLKNKVSEKIIYMSSHLTPYERLQRIERIKKKEVRLAVTTQLVEAGVDIDFDVVYRDMAPLDSIIQAVGRCNRNWKKKGECVLVYLRDERKTYASYIYDAILLEITSKILSKEDSIGEKKFLNLINAYYMEVCDRKSSDTSKEFIKAICNLKYSSTDETKGIGDFKLIDEDYQKFEVFVELNGEAQSIWREFAGIKAIKDLRERRIEFSKIKNNFYKYVISVPINIENKPPISNGFGYIGKDFLSDYYDEITGFKSKGNRVFLW